MCGEASEVLPAAVLSCVSNTLAGSEGGRQSAKDAWYGGAQQVTEGDEEDEAALQVEEAEQSLGWQWRGRLVSMCVEPWSRKMKAMLFET